MSLPKLVHAVGEVVKRDRLLRLPDVERIAGIRKSTIYGLMAQVPPAFPRCVQVTPRCVAWPESAVLQWVQDRISDANGKAVAREGGAQ
jgi:prophage regulatory protein